MVSFISHHHAQPPQTPQSSWDQCMLREPVPHDWLKCCLACYVHAHSCRLHCPRRLLLCPPASFNPVINSAKNQPAEELTLSRFLSPRSQAVGHVDLDDDLISEASFCEPPPRNPRRLLPQHQPCRPSSSLYEDIIVNSDTDSTSDTDGDTSSTASSYKLASLNMYGRPALEQISPPSSPDVSALRDW